MSRPYFLRAFHGPYVKILNSDFRHHNMLYTSGINSMPQRHLFDYRHHIKGNNGMWFCEDDPAIIDQWIQYYNGFAKWIATVNLCEDSRVSQMGLNLKTDKFRLSNFRPI